MKNPLFLSKPIVALIGLSALIPIQARALIQPEKRSAFEGEAFYSPALSRDTLASQTKISTNETELVSFLEKIPNQFGYVSSVEFPAESKRQRIALLIQDIHLNLNAQKNIRSLFTDLISDNQVEVIGLEGAFAPLNLGQFKMGPENSSPQASFEDLFNEGMISGPVSAALSHQGKTPPFFGVDDEGLYNDNVNAFLRASELKNQVEEFIALIQGSVNQSKAKTFNSDLLAFEKVQNAYDRGELDLKTYLAEIFHRTSHVGEQVKRFQKLLDYEAAINFTSVKVERLLFLYQLSQTLKPWEKRVLKRKMSRFQSGFITQEAFFQEFQRFCEDRGVSFQNYPNLSKYFSYALLSWELNPHALFEELNKSAQEIFFSLSQNEKERRLIRIGFQIQTLKSLTSFNLSSREWENYKILLPRSGESLFHQFPGESALSKVNQKTLQPFERFYENATKRNFALASNFITAMDESGAQKGALVIGGFHAEGVAEELSKAGVTTIYFLPGLSVSAHNEPSSFLSLFSSEKTALERLFQGAQMFMAPSPTP